MIQLVNISMDYICHIKSIES